MRHTNKEKPPNKNLTRLFYQTSPLHQLIATMTSSVKRHSSLWMRDVHEPTIQEKHQQSLTSMARDEMAKDIIST